MMSMNEKQTRKAKKKKNYKQFTFTLRAFFFSANIFVAASTKSVAVGHFLLCSNVVCPSLCRGIFWPMVWYDGEGGARTRQKKNGCVHVDFAHIGTGNCRAATACGIFKSNEMWTQKKKKKMSDAASENTNLFLFYIFHAIAWAHKKKSFLIFILPFRYFLSVCTCVAATQKVTHKCRHCRRHRKSSIVRQSHARRRQFCAYFICSSFLLWK